MGRSNSPLLFYCALPGQILMEPRLTAMLSQPCVERHVSALTEIVYCACINRTSVGDRFGNMFLGRIAAEMTSYSVARGERVFDSRCLDEPYAQCALFAKQLELSWSIRGYEPQAPTAGVFFRSLTSLRYRPHGSVTDQHLSGTLRRTEQLPSVRFY